MFGGGICSLTKIFLVFVFLLIGCGEKGPLNESSYQASSAKQPARNAALDTSSPSDSLLAWCRRQNDVGGYLQLNLGTMFFTLPAKLYGIFSSVERK